MPSQTQSRSARPVDRKQASCTSLQTDNHANTSIAVVVCFRTFLFCHISTSVTNHQHMIYVQYIHVLCAVPYNMIHTSHYYFSHLPRHHNPHNLLNNSVCTLITQFYRTDVFSSRSTEHRRPETLQTTDTSFINTRSIVQVSAHRTLSAAALTVSEFHSSSQRDYLLNKVLRQTETDHLKRQSDSPGKL